MRAQSTSHPFILQASPGQQIAAICSSRSTVGVQVLGPIGVPKEKGTGECPWPGAMELLTAATCPEVMHLHLPASDRESICTVSPWVAWPRGTSNCQGPWPSTNGGSAPPENYTGSGHGCCSEWSSNYRSTAEPRPEPWPIDWPIHPLGLYNSSRVFSFQKNSAVSVTSNF